MVKITHGWTQRMLRVTELGREAHLRIDCYCLPRIEHKAKLPLTVKGRINRDTTIYGYDGSCRFGRHHSVTFTRSHEVIASCPACLFTGRVAEGSKCGECGNPVDAIKVVTEHYAEKALRDAIKPGWKGHGEA